MKEPSQASEFLKKEKGLAMPKDPLLVTKSQFKHRLIVIAPGLITYFVLRFLEVDFLVAAGIALAVSVGMLVAEYL